jgi:hypothetical protein
MKGTCLRESPTSSESGRRPTSNGKKAWDHLSYPSAGDWGVTSNVYKTTRSYESRTDCGNPFVFPKIKSGHLFATEHILEIQCLGLFFEGATKGTLGSKKDPDFDPVHADFFVDEESGGSGGFNADVLDKTRAFYPGDPGEKVSKKPSFRTMGTLGSKTNSANFYTLENAVSGMKARVSADGAAGFQVAVLTFPPFSSQQIFGNKALVEKKKVD